MDWIEIIVSIFLISGAAFILIAAFGVLIMPNTLGRAHALSKGVTLGISLLLLGLWIQLGDQIKGFKILLILLFQFITIPISSHLFAYFIFDEIKHEKSDS